MYFYENFKNKFDNSKIYTHNNDYRKNPDWPFNNLHTERYKKINTSAGAYPTGTRGSGGQSPPEIDIIDSVAPCMSGTSGAIELNLNEFTNCRSSFFPYNPDLYFSDSHKLFFPFPPSPPPPPLRLQASEVPLHVFPVAAEVVESEANLMNNYTKMQSRGYEVIMHITKNVIPVYHKSDLPRDCVLKPISKLYHNIIADNKIQYISKIYIYIDGGYNPKATAFPMSWGIAVVFEGPDSQLLLSCCAGGIINNTWKLYLAHSKPSSFVAEVYANIIALIFLNNFFENPHKYTNLNLNKNVSVSIMFDNAPAAKCIFSPTRDGNEYNLVSIARALYIYTNRKIGNCITQHHIKSHSSHPLNEFVDDLCTHFLKCQESPFEPIPCHDINTLNVKCAHAFLMKDIPRISSSMDYPDIFDSNYYHVSDDTIASAIDVEHEELPCNFIPAYINIIQYNVLSLTEDRDKFAWILTTYNIALALCQETRSKTAGIKFFGNFIVVSSAAVNGVYGCEIWINTKISFGKLYNKNVYINSVEDVSIVLTDPRFLTISIAHGPLYFAATSAHAPYNKPVISREVKERWKEFSKQYNDIANKFKNRVLGIDANQKHGVTNPSSPVYDKLFG